ncbi:MAG: hypothetical protein HY002_17040 [Candidatus Rokubacteria bacterium]|nr:hypothetical protein [Candidatus Rokubacteria bacterium]
MAPPSPRTCAPVAPDPSGDPRQDGLSSPSERGISWAWYAGGWNEAAAGRPHAQFKFHHQPFVYFANYAEGTAARAAHLYDTTSILKLIETRWGLAPLGARDAGASDLTNAFDFSAAAPAR